MDLSLATENINSVRLSIELNGKVLDEVLDKYVTKNVAELDKILCAVKSALDDPDALTTAELESLALKLPTVIYFMSEHVERLGIRTDLAKLLEKDRYGKTLLAVAGTVKEREAIALKESQYENIVSAAVARAYKTIVVKIEAAQDLLAVVKKVLTRRIAENDIGD